MGVEGYGDRLGGVGDGAAVVHEAAGDGAVWVVSGSEQPSPWYAELAALVVGLTSQLERGPGADRRAGGPVEAGFD